MVLSQSQIRLERIRQIRKILTRRRNRRERAIQRLKASLEVDPVTGCHNFTGPLNDRGGYAQMSYAEDKHGYAHRLAWRIANNYWRPIPEGNEILHSCIGNRRCANPEHLRLGTKAENRRDALIQKRFHRCLTVAEINLAKAFVASGITIQTTAAIFRISTRRIYAFLAGKYSEAYRLPG